MKRYFLLMVTNIAIMAVLGVAVHLLGVDRWMHAKGLNYGLLFIFSLIFGFAGSFISLAISKWMAKMAYSIQIIEKPSNDRERWLIDTIQQQAKIARITMPEVGIYESPEANAFATGPSRSNSLIAVSSGLLTSMQRSEVEGVLAHEVSHIANGDMVTMTLLQGVLNTFVIFFSRIAAYFIDQALRKDDEESTGPGIGYLISSIVCQIIFGALASLVVSAYSRHREFRADADAARIWGKEPMIGALQRLQLITNQGLILDERSTAISSFKISGKPSGFLSWFSTHPPLEDRIAALERI